MLIDLDTVPALREEPARPPRIATRPLLGIVCLVLVALLAGSGRLAREDRPVVIPATLTGEMFVQDDRLFVVDNSHTTLRTYRLPDVRPLGSVVVRSLEEVSDVRQVGDTLMVTDQALTTAAVDARTGRELWRLSGAVLGATADTVLWGGGEVNHGAFSAIDPRTGAPHWSVPEPVDGFLVVAGEAGGLPRWLLSVGVRGRLTSYDARTGARLATVTAPSFGEINSMMAGTSGDLFIVGSGARGLTAYRLPDLTPRWRVPAEMAQNWMQGDCGPVICTYNQEGMTAIDPATGRTIWTAARWQSAEPLDGYLIATTVPTGAEAGRLSILDPATGRLRGDFGSWQGVRGPGGLRYAVHQAATPHAILYGELDPAHGTVRVLGEARRVSGNCVAGTGALVCRQLDASVAVWRLH